MPKCPVCKDEAFTIEVRRLEKVAQKMGEKPTGVLYKEKPMCFICYGKYKNGEISFDSL